MPWAETPGRNVGYEAWGGWPEIRKRQGGWRIRSAAANAVVIFAALDGAGLSLPLARPTTESWIQSRFTERLHP